MINIQNAKAYCKEDISLIENYKVAKSDKTKTWHCHHRLEILKNKSKQQLILEGRYWHVPASQLIFLSPAEHHSLHRESQQIYAKTQQKISKKRRETTTHQKPRKAYKAKNLPEKTFNAIENNLSIADCISKFML